MNFKTLRSKLVSHFQQLNPLFNADKWQRSHYILMQKEVNEGLRNSIYMTDELKKSHGSTISHMTLKRFFEKSYSDQASTDIRFIKTVDKLCIYLGYPNYQHFVDSFDEEDSSSVTLAELRQFIKEYMSIHVDFLAQAPENAERILGDYVLPDGPYFARLKELRKAMFERSLTLPPDSTIISNDLIDLKIISSNADGLVLEAQEFWFLHFIADEGTEVLYNNTGMRLYFLKKDAYGWKIWNNYNPDFSLYLKQLDASGKILIIG